MTHRRQESSAGVRWHRGSALRVLVLAVLSGVVVVMIACSQVVMQGEPGAGVAAPRAAPP